MKGANLEEANLEGVKLGRLKLETLQSVNVRKATYNKKTSWPDGFDPKAAGAINVDEKGQ